MNDYYVYIYYRLDTNEPFYIGEGHNNRWKDIWKRNNHFKNIINKHPIAVEIIANNLTQEQANGIECWLINELVFEYGYSIDIPNNRSRERGYHLVNMTWGGEGASGISPFENKTEDEILEIKRKMSEFGKTRTGEKNSFYGKHHTEETKSKLSEASKGKYCGENNPMYGRTWWDENTPQEKIDEWKSKLGTKGENHPMYGKHHTEETKKKIGKANSGRNNPRARAVICITTGMIFDTAKEGAEYYNCHSNYILYCCRGYRYVNKERVKIKSAGKLPDGTPLVWRKIVWNHGKRYRIKK